MSVCDPEDFFSFEAPGIIYSRSVVLFALGIVRLANLKQLPIDLSDHCSALSAKGPSATITVPPRNTRLAAGSEPLDTRTQSLWCSPSGFAIRIYHQGLLLVIPRVHGGVANIANVTNIPTKRFRASLIASYCGSNSGQGAGDPVHVYASP